MKIPFLKFSFSFVMDLYRVKKRAEERKDVSAIEELKQNYPELFTAEFDDFIDNVRLSAAKLDQKYGENFSSMLDSEWQPFIHHKFTLN